MNVFALCILIVCMFLTSVLHANGHPTSETNEVSYEREVYNYLMRRYQRQVRPVKKDTDTVDLTINLYINLLEDLDEVNQALQASGWMYMRWNDFQLSWDPANFGNVTKTRLRMWAIWFPDVAIINSFDLTKMMPRSYQLAVVTSNGDITWVPAMNFRTHCALDLTHFPFDEHTCSIRVITWTYDEAEVNMTTQESTYYKPYVESSEWEVKSVEIQRNSQYYACCPNPFVDIDFKLRLRRRPTFASHLFIAPSVILCLISPSVFLLPPASFEKLTLGTGLLIGHVLLLGELISFVPSAHPTIPLMGKFFLANIVMVSLSLFVSVIVLNLWNRSKTRCVGPPSFCRTILLNSWVTRILLIDFTDYEFDDHDQSSSQGRPGNNQAGTLEVMTDGSGNTATTDDRARIIDQSFRVSAKSDWRYLAIVVDRFFFVVFAIILIATCLAFTGYM